MKKDRTLHRLKKYLEDTLLPAMQADGANIQDVLRQHPFQG